MDTTPDTVGIVVGRFQVRNPHAGHTYLINSVRERHTEVCIVLGTTDAELVENNPLSANVRRLMLQNRFPGIVVCELKDCPSDKIWSEALDTLITNVFPGRAARLYGSRGSFVSSYSGHFPIEELKHVYLESGTYSRQVSGKEPQDSAEFRDGIIYAAYARRPAVYPTVDVAVVNPEQRTTLLGRKKGDGGKFRFIGGFIDPTDLSIEAAARRELYEEAGRNLNVGDFTILGTAKMDDPRYRGTKDGIMTTFFRTNRLSGFAKAGDDIHEVGWFPHDEVGERLVDVHAPLGAIFNRLIRDAV